MTTFNILFVLAMFTFAGMMLMKFKTRLRSKSDHKTNHKLLMTKEQRELEEKKAAQALALKKHREYQEKYINAPQVEYLYGNQKLFEVEQGGELLISYSGKAAMRKLRKGKGKRYTPETAPLERKIFAKL